MLTLSEWWVPFHGRIFKNSQRTQVKPEYTEETALSHAIA